MAKRRLRDRLLSGLGDGLTNVGGLMLRTHMQDKLQSRYDDRAAASAAAVADRADIAAKRTSALEALKSVADGERDPAQAASLIAAITGQEIEPALFESVRPSPRRRMEKAVGDGIDKAQKPEDVLSDASIAGMARTEGLALPEAAYAGVEPTSFAPDAQGTPTGDPFEHVGGVAREFGERAGARRRSLESVPSERVEVEGNDGAKTVQFVSPYAGNVQTSPNAEQRGKNEGTLTVAKETTVLGNDKLTDLKGKTEARIANLVENLTRQAKVNTAAATAGATKRAELAPDIVAGEVAKAKALSEGKENSTESERRAATNWAPLVKAHATALDLEKNGARVGAGDRMFTDWPLLNRTVDPQTQQYMQAAKDFISTLGLIRSGVTVRPDEADSLFSTMFGTTGDSSTSLSNKQQSREVFLASMQAMVGRSGDEAGRILAAAINQKQIPTSVLTSLQFDNKKLKDSLLANLKGIPKFDAQGNLIGVQQ